jgi:hypothetical protein
MTSTGQRALIRAARSCRNEAGRADRLGQIRYAAQLRASAARALAEAGAEGSEYLINAISSVKSACDLADDLPDRAADTDGHEVTVKTMHAHVQSARGYLEQHLNPAGLPKSRRRRRGGQSRPSGPSGTDDDVSYQPDLVARIGR